MAGRKKRVANTEVNPGFPFDAERSEYTKDKLGRDAASAILPLAYRNKPVCKGWGGYMGARREPRLPDEAGAAQVIETMFSDGERLAFFKIPGSDYYEVRKLPAPT